MRSQVRFPKSHTYLLPLLLSVVVSSSSFAQERVSVRPAAAAPISITDSTRERDGLIGPVRRVRTELAKLVMKSGRPVEGQRILLESTAYDLKGRRVENSFYPVDESAVIGKEEYSYDEKGNVVEKILRDDSGAVLGKEAYKYEFDAVGNWTKMTTLVAVVEGGQVNFEPTEVIHRTFTYFFGQATAPPADRPASAAGIKVAGNATGTPGEQTAALDVSPASRMMPNLGHVNEGAPWLKSGAAAATPEAAERKAAGRDVSVNIAGEVPTLKTASKYVSSSSSSDLQLGKPLQLPKPIYPDVARQSRLSGPVAVEVMVNGKGEVISARAVSGHSQLRGAAVEAARRAVFSPTLLSGTPTTVVGIINYSFSYIK